jgi:hypothetical protein
MERIGRILVTLGLAGFLTVTLLLITTYVNLLWVKIESPHLKNMNDQEAIRFGLVAVVIIIIDFFIIRRFIQSIRKKFTK